MAKCKACRQEMLSSKGCTFRYIRLKDGRNIQRLRAGNRDGILPGERCPDCGAMYGYLHHVNCDMEVCPVCGGQLLSCSCPITGYSLMPD